MSSLTYVEDYPPFQKDFKKLSKKYRTLEQDFEMLKKAAINLYHAIPPIDNNSIEKIEGSCSDKLWICKIRKIACRSLAGKCAKSGLRIVYAFFPDENKITFLEFYYKGDKPMEDKERIKNFVKYYCLN